jgi:O-antigen ligase
VATVVAVLAIGVGLAVRSSSNDSNSINTEGHGTLVSGGLKLAKHRPLYGYGSASFSKEFAREENVPPGDTTISHSEPVTVAAEQGAIGVLAYLALLAAALWAMLAGMPGTAPGWGGKFRSLADGDRVELIPARIGVAAAFIALLVHTVGYAAYLTDPLTWALLAVGGVLAAEVGAGEWPTRAAESRPPAETPAPPTVAG